MKRPLIPPHPRLRAASMSRVSGPFYAVFTAEDKAVELAANEMLSDEARLNQRDEPDSRDTWGVYLIKIIERQDARVLITEKIALQVKRR